MRFSSNEIARRRQQFLLELLEARRLFSVGSGELGEAPLRSYDEIALGYQNSGRMLDIEGLASTNYISGGGLVLIGTEHDDLITLGLSPDGERMIATINGELMLSAPVWSGLREIEIYGGGGTDSIVLDYRHGEIETPMFIDPRDGDAVTTHDSIALTPKAEIVNGLLMVNGSDSDDEITLAVGSDGASLEAYVNGELLGTFSQDDISSLMIFGCAGNDLIRIDETHGTLSSELHTYFFGGRGDDQVTGSAKKDFMEGGSGNDLLIGGEGDDIIVGKSGNDTLRGGLGVDALIDRDNDDGNTTDVDVFEIGDKDGHIDRNDWDRVVMTDDDASMDDDIDQEEEENDLSLPQDDSDEEEMNPPADDGAIPPPEPDDSNDGDIHTTDAGEEEAPSLPARALVGMNPVSNFTSLFSDKGLWTTTSFDHGTDSSEDSDEVDSLFN